MIRSSQPVAAPRPTAPPVKVAPPPRPAALPRAVPPTAPPAPRPAPPPLPAPIVGEAKVAILLPLSGRHKTSGAALLDAAQLALFEVGSNSFVLLPRDTKGTPEGARAAAEDAIAAGAHLILGPLFSGSVRAVAPLARAAAVNVIAFSSDRTVSGDGIFLLGFSPRGQVERVVAYAVAKGVSRFAALVPDTAYGAEVLADLRRAAAAAGADVGPVEIYAPDETDFAPAVRRIADFESRRGALLAMRRELGGREDEAAARARRRLEGKETTGGLSYQALFLPEGGTRVQAIAPLIPYYDIDTTKIRLIGTGLWDDAAIGKEPALVGGWFAGPSPTARAGFEARYAQAFGRRPLRLATLAYDATALAAALARSEGGADFSAAVLTSANGFDGVDGIFRFAIDAVAERGLAVLEVRPDGPRSIADAPTTFEAQAF